MRTFVRVPYRAIMVVETTSKYICLSYCSVYMAQWKIRNMTGFLTRQLGYLLNNRGYSHIFNVYGLLWRQRKSNGFLTRQSSLHIHIQKVCLAYNSVCLTSGKTSTSDNVT